MFEFSYDTLTPQQKDAYLQRIGCAGLSEVCKETLDKLIYMHQCTVPFESLDIFAGCPEVPLDGASLYNKIVERRRGGFCYELNGLFVMLLRAMGFDAYSCMCRVAANRTVLSNLFHRGTVVRLEGKQYLCDVGLGGPMAPFAVEISDKRQTQHGETYWIEPTYEGWYLQKRLASDGSESNVIIFAAMPFLGTDFIPYCNTLINTPGTAFRTTRMVNLRTENGNYNLRGNTLTITDSGVHRDIEFSDNELSGILKKYYNMDY